MKNQNKNEGIDPRHRVIDKLLLFSKNLIIIIIMVFGVGVRNYTWDNNYTNEMYRTKYGFKHLDQADYP